MSKLENVIIGLLLGGIIGGAAGTIAARFPPLTLPQDQTSPGLNESNQAFGLAVGILGGEIIGGAIALATE